MTAPTETARRALEELASRGFGHPNAQEHVGAIRTALDQADAMIESATPPPPTPVDEALRQVRDELAALRAALPHP